MKVVSDLDEDNFSLDPILYEDSDTDNENIIKESEEYWFICWQVIYLHSNTRVIFITYK